MNKDNVRNLIKKTIKIFEKPNSWRRRANARDARGQLVESVMSPKAVSFCIRGGVMRAAGVTERHDMKVFDTLNFLGERAKADFNAMSLIDANDDKIKDKRTVLRFLNRALKSLDA